MSWTDPTASPTREEVLADLKWKKFPALDDGFICLVDAMGDDSSVVQAARVSYGAGTKKVSTEEGLIRYLMRNRHTTPFEMAELKFMVRVPMDTWRQWIRHRTANVNEYSTRYSEAIDSQQQTPPDGWRAQATTNRQGSSGFITEWPEGWSSVGTVDAWVVTGTKDRRWEFKKAKYLLQASPLSPGQFLSFWEEENQGFITKDYNIRLELGVAREVARKDLPLSTYTEAYWKMDLHNLLHFLALRMDGHAQLEIRTYATIIGEQIVKPLFPKVWKAFEDYRLNAMYMTGLEKVALRTLMATLEVKEELLEQALAHIENDRERTDAYSKLKSLLNVVKP